MEVSSNPTFASTNAPDHKSWLTKKALPAVKKALPVVNKILPVAATIIPGLAPVAAVVGAIRR